MDAGGGEGTGGGNGTGDGGGGGDECGDGGGGDRLDEGGGGGDRLDEGGGGGDRLEEGGGGGDPLDEGGEGGGEALVITTVADVMREPSAARYWATTLPSALVVENAERLVVVLASTLNVSLSVSPLSNWYVSTTEEVAGGNVLNFSTAEHATELGPALEQVALDTATVSDLLGGGGGDGCLGLGGGGRWAVEGGGGGELEPTLVTDERMRRPWASRKESCTVPDTLLVLKMEALEEVSEAGRQTSVYDLPPRV